MAARLLARTPRTEAELEARLVALGYRRETAAATVARCPGTYRSLSDDVRRALRGVRDRRRAWRLLVSRGFPEEVVVEVLGEAE